MASKNVPRQTFASLFDEISSIRFVIKFQTREWKLSERTWYFKNPGFTLFSVTKIYASWSYVVTNDMKYQSFGIFSERNPRNTEYRNVRNFSIKAEWNIFKLTVTVLNNLIVLYLQKYYQVIGILIANVCSKIFSVIPKIVTDQSIMYFRSLTRQVWKCLFEYFINRFEDLNISRKNLLTECKEHFVFSNQALYFTTKRLLLT